MIGVYYPLGPGEEISEGEYEYQYALCAAAGLGDVERPPAPLRPEAPEGHWRVRGGALLEIRKMTEDHLRNAVTLAERRGASAHPKIDELRAELERRFK